MKNLSIAVLGALALAFVGLGATQAPATKAAAADRLTVHEWGTFTSVAGEDGRAVQWQPLTGTPDLPCFVHRFQFKGSVSGRVRMETPVLYFYAPDDMTVNVNIRFLQGIVTEWFPRAAVTSTGRSSAIGWTHVKVSPNAPPAFPTDGGGSHYYVARQTDASPLQAGSATEKFLFYRGVGDFEPPITATIAGDGRIVVTNPRGESIGDVVLFTNAGGTIDYQVQHAVGGRVTFNPPAGAEELAPPIAELERILVAQGLFPKEAQAMVNTWRDSWFEEGTRVFSVVSGKMIDSILPLEINPAPSNVTRVFVGRVELITPRTNARFLQTRGHSPLPNASSNTVNSECIGPSGGRAGVRPD